MNHWKWTRAALAGALALGVVGAAAPAYAVTGDDEAPTVAEQAAEHLPKSELNIWNALSEEQKDTVNEILEDPKFGVPGAAESLERQYPELEVTEQVSTASAAEVQGAGMFSLAAAATKGKRSVWYQQDWKILMVTYASVRTTINVNYHHNNVTKINSCSNDIGNDLPTRKYTSKNTKSLNSDGTATCRTEVTLKVTGQSMKSGVQGLKISGNGTIVKKWKL
ncbi:hypothetical protein LWF15_25645 [Kineosporia rhizophila]|uniref:hypothetical protein n=1 Tax=Kineosporia rhizophila TaxID=84633 RepID=UPI000ADD0E26|nr:hypothetical protein [Kineosporia rhizophila]MCE0538888.1 hypothetical protein [Kineosporia rhizophila]